MKLIIKTLLVIIVTGILYFLLFVYQPGGICVQTLVFERNPITGETREFATPCQVPYGWR